MASLPEPPDMMSLPRPPHSLSAPLPPEIVSFPAWPLMQSRPAPPKRRSCPTFPYIRSPPLLPLALLSNSATKKFVHGLVVAVTGALRAESAVTLPAAFVCVCRSLIVCAISEDPGVKVGPCPMATQCWPTLSQRNQPNVDEPPPITAPAEAVSGVDVTRRPEILGADVIV